MKTTLLAIWRLEARSDFTTSVIPDGCRDLIFRRPCGERPFWFLSSLDDHSHEVKVRRGDVFTGYRLVPGTRIDEAGLIASVRGAALGDDEVLSRLESHTGLRTCLSDALDCLASGAGSVGLAARQLGVSPRSLQRLVCKGTGRSPVYWLQLARVRRAGRAVQKTRSLTEVALEHGFADQSHMNREFRRWLGLSPSALRAGAEQGRRLCEPGYS